MPAGRSTSTLAAASRAVIALVTERTQPPQVIPETLYFVAIINPPFGVLVIGYSALGIWRAGIGLDQPLGWCFFRMALTGTSVKPLAATAGSHSTSASTVASWGCPMAMA